MQKAIDAERRTRTQATQPRPKAKLRARNATDPALLSASGLEARQKTARPVPPIQFADPTLTEQTAVDDGALHQGDGGPADTIPAPPWLGEDEPGA
jgi:hypothetical protein